MESDWREIYREIRKNFTSFRKAKISREFSEKLTKDLDYLKNLFVEEVSGENLKVTSEWISNLKSILRDVCLKLGLENVTFPPELKSFIDDPKTHLKKKLFTYAMDLARGKMSLKMFEDRGRRAIQTSLQTNLRNIYQSWIFLTLISHLSEDGGVVVYPECRYLSLERSGKQKVSIIPPNIVISTSRGLLSFFLEAPRPVSWEDTNDLKKVWSLYKAMRPDILVYSGIIMNILEIDLDPPIKKPDLIIEVKELEDWYQRTREIKRIEQPISAEEWRFMWLRGLWEGLGKELGARTEPEKIEDVSRKNVKLRELELVKLYREVYKPKKMILVARCPSPPNVRKNLEENGIMVIDNVGFDRDKLRKLSEIVLSYATSSEDVLILKGELARAIYQKSRELGKHPEFLIKKIIEVI
ncbi:MAG: hypothetical protein QXE44_01775 [Nitrososphaerota archaeon]